MMIHQLIAAVNISASSYHQSFVAAVAVGDAEAELHHECVPLMLKYLLNLSQLMFCAIVSDESLETCRLVMASDESDDIVAAAAVEFAVVAAGTQCYPTSTLHR